MLNFLLFIWIGTPCFRGYGRRNGERRRKSVRGCIVSQDLSVLNLVIVKKGENDLPGLTDTEKPRMRGPKRASKIRKLFNLSKEDDVRKYVNTYRRSFTTKSGKRLLSFRFSIFLVNARVVGYAKWLLKNYSVYLKHKHNYFDKYVESHLETEFSFSSSLGVARCPF